MTAKENCVMTSQEMRANAHQCLSWSESAHYRENREAFFALARAWMSAAIRLEQEDIPLETPLPAAPTMEGSASRRRLTCSAARFRQEAIAQSGCATLTSPSELNDANGNDLPQRAFLCRLSYELPLATFPPLSGAQGPHNHSGLSWPTPFKSP